jgi:two-component system response regulator AtoC
LLVIDDEENMRHMLASLLGKAGYLVDTASEGYEGLQMIDRNQYNFILCDIKMSRIDGMEFLRSARDKIADTTVIRKKSQLNIKKVSLPQLIKMIPGCSERFP